MSQSPRVDEPLKNACKGGYSIFHVDAFDWLSDRPGNSIHAIVTDPPYGLVEYR